MKRGVVATAVLVAAGCLLTACGTNAVPQASASVSGIVLTGGSSTLGPLTQSIGERFSVYNPGVKVEVAMTSTGEGLKAFCEQKLDVVNASRRIEPAEVEACKKAGITYTEVLAANDAISVIVHKQNNWAKCLTVEQLKTLWAPAAEGRITTWKQLDPGYPTDHLVLFGPDSTSGTLDMFTLAITGTEKAIRKDYTASQDDHVTLRGVRDNRGAIGFLGLSYVRDNEDIVKAIAVDNGSGCVTPTATSVRDASYAPLSRPLYVYVSNSAFKSKPQVKAFMEYYVQWARNVAVDTNFVAVTETQRQEARRQLEALEKG